MCAYCGLRCEAIFSIIWSRLGSLFVTTAAPDRDSETSLPSRDVAQFQLGRKGSSSLERGRTLLFSKTRSLHTPIDLALCERTRNAGGAVRGHRRRSGEGTSAHRHKVRRRNRRRTWPRGTTAQLRPPWCDSVSQMMENVRGLERGPGSREITSIRFDFCQAWRIFSRTYATRRNSQVATYGLVIGINHCPH
jgi:hypothetical protein